MTLPLYHHRYRHVSGKQFLSFARKSLLQAVATIAQRHKRRFDASLVRLTGALWKYTVGPVVLTKEFSQGNTKWNALFRPPESRTAGLRLVRGEDGQLAGRGDSALVNSGAVYPSLVFYQAEARQVLRALVVGKEAQDAMEEDTQELADGPARFSHLDSFFGKGEPDEQTKRYIDLMIKLFSHEHIASSPASTSTSCLHIILDLPLLLDNPGRDYAAQWTETERTRATTRGSTRAR
ncbi:uncharacterized protein PHACADRAFT_201752 [Phanerochaete carnosa HHB-10118-sp]|uniref:Uncharacterized protein n=1 Tax=Phanerochaete carnosa (strain HHB-10118-sp) TaxID=650164 RepID=K5VE26_PHACS|nr:uncharacterized protein PHACADRAFT_201752 [Phanerochaete carnosa HHB-10118-sp]EKM49363.1 hypothetical protein PHACADRAFT_201752 [Phanerochaete carnosa HHB-10118-sp]